MPYMPSQLLPKTMKQCRKLKEVAMQVRSSHFELYSLGDDVVARDDLELFFEHASIRKHAWMTGSVHDISAEEAMIVAAGYGYDVWAPEITANGVSCRTASWIAVREDLVLGEAEKFFELLSFGANQTDEAVSGPPTGLVMMSFEPNRKGLGKIHVATASHFEENLKNLFDSWYDRVFNDDETVFFGSPKASFTAEYPTVASSNERVLMHSRTTQNVSFVNDFFYEEFTTSIKAMANR